MAQERKRVVAICLDAFDFKLSDDMIAKGLLPGLAKCRDNAARFQLQHGQYNGARDTGLTGEHVATGLRPETTGRWAPILFDPATYSARQKFTTEIPYFAQIDAKCVVIDATYFDLEKSRNCRGIVGWSGHDPGVLPYSRPASLRAEIDEKFGEPVDTDLLHQNVYGDVEAVKTFSKYVEAAARQRADVAKWLLTKRLDEWDIALVAFSEGHDGIEQLYHGVFPDHHLSDLQSASAAKDGLESIYTAISDGIETLMDAIPDATFVIFSMHGMGQNQTDVPSMLLLPELLYRREFNRPYFRSREDWITAGGAAALYGDEDWLAAVTDAQTHPIGHTLSRLPFKAFRKIRRKSKSVLANAGLTDGAGHQLSEDEFEVNWIPADRYRDYWPRMSAFAVPCLFDGRVRINLKGREANGIVPLAEYHKHLSELERMLSQCTDPQTGDPIVDRIERPGEADPLALNDSQSDLHIVWNNSPLAFFHPDIGTVGPAPMRRVGGHTGGFGAIYITGENISVGDYGLRSSFDVAPTIVDLAGCIRPNRLDGESALSVLQQDRIRSTG